MQSVLNEGSFLDFISDIANASYQDIKKSRDKNKSTYMYGSISSYTKKLTMTFPVICDNTIPISTSQLIGKAHEKNLVTLFEMYFASTALNGTSGIEILSSIHKNLDSTSIDDIIDSIEKGIGEAGYPFNRSEFNDIINEMVYDLKYNQKTLPVESLAERSLNEYLVRNNPYSGTVVMEAKGTKGRNDYNDGYEAGKRDQKESDESKRKEYEFEFKKGEYYGYAPETSKEKRDRIRRQTEREEDRTQRETEREEDRKQRATERREDRDQREIERGKSNDFRLAQSRVKDVDYKKANELQPSLLTVQFSVDNGKDGAVEYKTFNAGIKSRLVGSDPMEIVERISASKSNKLSFRDLIRATTGEISLVKDFIMATKQAKLNAKNAAKRGETAKMWNLLASRAKLNSTAVRTATRSNEANAITTLLVSQETVNYINNQYKIDLSSPKEATKVMKAYNLLALVIADESNEVAKFLYDGNTSYELVSYNALSKEQKDDRNYNKAINLINRSGR